MLQRLIETKIITPLRPGFKIKSKIKLTFVVKSLPFTFLIAYIENKQISLTFGDCLLWIYPDGFWLKQLSYFSLNDISISGNLNFQIWYATDFSVFVSYSWVLMSHNFWKPAYSSSTILGCHGRWTAKPLHVEREAIVKAGKFPTFLAIMHQLSTQLVVQLVTLWVS